MSWVNAISKGSDKNPLFFTALHFASFNGNLKVDYYNMFNRI